MSNDIIKNAIAGAVRLQLYKENLLSWKYEVTTISDLQTQIKVYPPDNYPPRYFIVQVKEGI